MKKAIYIFFELYRCMKNEIKNIQNDLSIKINKEAKVIDSWCLSSDFDAYTRYTQNGYFEKINNALRTGYTNDFLVQSDILSLDRLFSKIPKQVVPKKDFQVYRGARITPELNEILQQKSKDNVILEKAYVSTSKNIHVAKQFAQKEHKVIFHITIPKGSKIIDDDMLPSYVRSKMKGEQEVLLPRNAQFLITGYNPQLRIVEARYIGQKLPLEQPEFFEYSGQNILADLNKNSLLIDKTYLFNKEYKNKK